VKVNKSLEVSFSFSRRILCRIGLGSLLYCLFCSKVWAVLFFQTGDPSHNTSPPEGELDGSGWQFQGRWVSFSGTVIAPYFFISARHVGGSIGSEFFLNDHPHRTVEFFDSPISDLRIWRVCEPFSNFAKLYERSDEVGKEAIIFGRGTRRGKEVVVPDGQAGELKGWEWGEQDGVMRWGRNVVSDVVSRSIIDSDSPQESELLKATFDANGVLNEVHLTVGDSGGAIFIRDGEEWKLAGIHFAVDGPHQLSESGTEVSLALFDQGGLFLRTGGKAILIKDRIRDIPSAFYSSRISCELNWIQSIIHFEVQVSERPILQFTEQLNLEFQDMPNAVIDERSKTITVSKSTSSQYYRLRACRMFRIVEIKLENDFVVVHYE